MKLEDTLSENYADISSHTVQSMKREKNANVEYLLNLLTEELIELERISYSEGMKDLRKRYEKIAKKALQKDISPEDITSFSIFAAEKQDIPYIRTIGCFF